MEAFSQRLRGTVSQYFDNGKEEKKEGKGFVDMQLNLVLGW
jgi:hypothetical protein